jgi:hypothetical protein
MNNSPFSARLTVQDGLDDYTVCWVCEDNHGVIWAETPTGIARLKNGRIHFILREHGLFDANIYAMIPDDHGSLWVNQLVPPVLVHRIRANGSDRTLTNHLIIEPGKGELEFFFTALTFIAPQNVT